MNHEWEDVSYHGSALYQCEFCGIYKYQSKDDNCPKAKICLKQKAEKEEREERWEYERMLKKIERFKFLHNKYGEQNNFNEEEYINIIEWIQYVNANKTT